MRQKQVALLPLHPGVVLRLLVQVQFSPVNVILRVNFHPGMIEGGVVGNKIEHQSEAALVETLAQTEQRIIAPSCR